MLFTSKDDQSKLLQKVLAANDTDADEEQMIGEGGASVKSSGKVHQLDFFSFADQLNRF